MSWTRSPTARRLRVRIERVRTHPAGDAGQGTGCAETHILGARTADHPPAQLPLRLSRVFRRLHPCLGLLAHQPPRFPARQRLGGARGSAALPAADGQVAPADLVDPDCGLSQIALQADGQADARRRAPGPP